MARQTHHALIDNSVCAVIPAAGEGRRLGSDLPKILLPIARGRTVWDILHGKLAPLTDHTHLVLSPQGAGLFQKKFLEAGELKKVGVSIQPVPRGMGDAVFGAYDYWKTFEHILIIWGDQVNVSSQTLKSILRAQQGARQETLTLAINRVELPYVQYVFNKDLSALIEIKQSREGDQCESQGYTDVGVFVLTTASLMEAWKQYSQNATRGSQTGEINFLPFLIYLSQDLHWKLNCVQISDPLESRGINTMEDLEFFRKKFDSEEDK